LQPFAEAFYKSKAWLDCRGAYISSVLGLCEKCGAGGKIAHHIIELTPLNINDPSITLNFDNLQLLCQDCHNKVRGQTDAVREGLRFDENGNLVQIAK